MTGSSEISLTAYLSEWTPVGEELIHQTDFEYSWFVTVWFRERDGSYALVTQAGFHPSDFMICDRRRFRHRDKWTPYISAVHRNAQEEIDRLRTEQPLEEKYRDFLANRSS